ncbi:hypothetical protein XENTR_v10022633 [Xenopus tropicalis]|nr:hypothetical protein XENTR_v10022633 [Xenopus tropicalis]
MAGLAINLCLCMYNRQQEKSTCSSQIVALVWAGGGSSFRPGPTELESMGRPLLSIPRWNSNAVSCLQHFRIYTLEGFYSHWFLGEVTITHSKRPACLTLLQLTIT